MPSAEALARPAPDLEASISMEVEHPPAPVMQPRPQPQQSRVASSSSSVPKQDSRPPSVSLSAWARKWKLAVALLAVLMVHMLAVNVLVPSFASPALRLRGTVMVHTVTETTEVTEISASRMLQEREGANAQHKEESEASTTTTTTTHTLQEATAVAAVALQQVAVTEGAAAAAIKAGPHAIAAAAAAVTAAAGRQPVPEPEQPWPRPKSNKPRKRVPNVLSEWQCSPEGLQFTAGAAAAQSKYWLSSVEYVARYQKGVPKYKWCRGAPPELVPQLKQVIRLRSDKPPPPRGLTIVTQLSVERFGMLENQCRNWPYQISATLYVPLVGGRMFSAEEKAWHKQPIDAAIVQAIKFHNHAEACPTCCILDLEVVVEERCERQAAMLYPANSARNRALLRAQTEAVLLLDVDFCPSHELAKLVDDVEAYGRLMAMLEANKAVVLPAFEPVDQEAAGKALALEAIAQEKDFVSQEYRKNRMIGFHMGHYHQGHGATDFPLWTQSSDAYPINWTIGFEPYILMARKYVPFYDERFRGYFWNKVEHLMHVNLQNRFDFWVHPRAFVVHVPHPQPSTKWLTRHSGQKDKNHAIFNEALEFMGQQVFVPVTAFPELCVPPTVRAKLSGGSSNAAFQSGLDWMQDAAAQQQALEAEQQQVGQQPGQEQEEEDDDEEHLPAAKGKSADAPQDKQEEQQQQEQASPGAGAAAVALEQPGQDASASQNTQAS